MTEIDYHKVGEEFEYNGRKYKVVDTCVECDLSDQCAGADSMNCIYLNRDDFKNVIYKEINKRKEMGTLLLRVISILFLMACAAVVISLFLQGLYLFGLMFMLCCLFVVADAWVNGSKS